MYKLPEEKMRNNTASHTLVCYSLFAPYVVTGMRHGYHATNTMVYRRSAERFPRLVLWHHRSSGFVSVLLAHALENENFENPIYLPCNPIVTQSIQIE